MTHAGIESLTSAGTGASETPKTAKGVVITDIQTYDKEHFIIDAFHKVSNTDCPAPTAWLGLPGSDCPAPTALPISCQHFLDSLVLTAFCCRRACSKIA